MEYGIVFRTTFPETNMVRNYSLQVQRLLFLLYVATLFCGDRLPTSHGAGLRPDVITDSLNIEVGPGPNALRLKDGQQFTLNCTITNIRSHDVVDDVVDNVVDDVEWTYENELDNVLKTVTMDEDYVKYDSDRCLTTYRFEHHPSSVDAGDYNCTFYAMVGGGDEGSNSNSRRRVILAQKTIRLTCDPIPIEGVKWWKGLREDDPMRKDYKHVPSFTVYPGDTQTLECRATAYPKPSFRWFRIEPGVEEDDDIGTANRTEIPDRSTTDNSGTEVFPLQQTPENDGFLNDLTVIAEGPILRIINATYAHRGYYCCRTNNSDDYSLNMYFMIRVKNPMAVLWPALCLIGIGVSTRTIIAISEVMRKKAEAKEKRRHSSSGTGSHNALSTTAM